MITYNDLQEAIAECEGVKSPNANTCIKLAAFYTIMNNLYPENVPPSAPSYSFQAADTGRITYDSDTEFARLVDGRGTEGVLGVMDELMSTLQIVNPRLYDAVMRKLNNI